jgi:hypothetical protein
MLNHLSFPLVLSLRLVRNLSEERFQTSWNDKNKSGFPTSQNDYMKARASVIKISPGTINGKSRKRRHAYAYNSI